MAICKHYEKISSGLALGVFMVVLALLQNPYQQLSALKL
jgi:hypothetical protein